MNDTDKNIAYDVEKDLIGIPWCDIKLSKSNNMIENFMLILSKEDTTAPYVTEIKALNKNCVSINFSEPIKIKNFPKFLSPPIDAKDKDVTIKKYNLDLTEKNKLYLFTSNQAEGKDYYIDLFGIEDLFDNKITDKSDPVSFVGSSLNDTTAPNIIYSVPEDSSRNLSPDSRIEIQFSEPIDTILALKGISLTDIDGNPIPGKIVWKAPTIFVFFLFRSFEGSMKCVLKREYISDLYGNRLNQDFNLNLEIGSSFGLISGKVIAGEDENIILVLYDSETLKEVLREEITDRDSYNFNYVKPGKYVLFAFSDRDGDGKFYYGTSFPFKPSEKFTFYPELVIVRSGWDNEDIDLIFYNYN